MPWRTLVSTAEYNNKRTLFLLGHSLSERRRLILQKTFRSQTDRSLENNGARRRRPVISETTAISRPKDRPRSRATTYHSHRTISWQPLLLCERAQWQIRNVDDIPCLTPESSACVNRQSSRVCLSWYRRRPSQLPLARC